MPYREKIAWLSLFAIVVTFSPYFVWSALYPPVEPLPNMRQLGLYAVAALARVVLLGIGYWLLRRSAPEDARMPADERDTAIQHRATSFAYYVLMVGMILVGGIMPFTYSGWAIVNAALFMLALSEAVSHAVVAHSYRRHA